VRLIGKGSEEIAINFSLSKEREGFTEETRRKKTCDRITDGKKKRTGRIEGRKRETN
jgi:hypothetical protein